jgi:hypothetical protein
MLKVLLHMTMILIMTTSMATARVQLIRLDELPERADFVIEGKVKQKTARWDAGGIMINTHYIIDVQTVILGDAPKTVELSFAGGTVKDRTIEVSHTPVLEVGRTYILFCHPNNRFSVPTVGHDQGVFKVIRDAQTQQDRIVDYNGYQIERTAGSRRLIRGRLTRIDANGALVQRRVQEKSLAKPLTPVVRDADGNIVDQDGSAVPSNQLREPSEPVTRSEFIRFIQTPAQRGKGAKK